MPHCIIEYSENLDQEVPPVEWLEAVKKACQDSELFDGPDIKVRAMPYRHFSTTGPEDAFVHVTVCVLSGRSTEQRQRLSQRILESLTQFSLTRVSFSVDICNMDREIYAKRVVC